MTSRFGNKTPKKNELITDDASMELSIDKDHINDEIMNQPLLLRKWTDICSKASKNVKIIELQLERAKARWYLEYKKEGGSVKELDSRVKLNEEVVELENKLIDREKTLEQLKGVVTGFRQRHELLKEISTNIRKDLED